MADHVRYRRHSGASPMSLWYLLMLELWLQEFIDPGRPGGNPAVAEVSAPHRPDAAEKAP